MIMKKIIFFIFVVLSLTALASCEAKNEVISTEIASSIDCNPPTPILKVPLAHTVLLKD